MGPEYVISSTISRLRSMWYMGVAPWNDGVGYQEQYFIVIKYLSEFEANVPDTK